MKRIMQAVLAAAMALALSPALAQSPRIPRDPGPGSDEPQFPNGKSRSDEILKEDHRRDVKDAAQLVELAQQLKVEIERNDRRVLSMASLKKTEEIEKLAKRIHSRLVH